MQLVQCGGTDGGAWHFPCTSLSLCYKNVGKSFSLFFTVFYVQNDSDQCRNGHNTPHSSHTHTYTRTLFVCVCVHKLLSNCCEGISRRWIWCCANFVLGYLIEFTTRRRCQILSKIHTQYLTDLYTIYVLYICMYVCNCTWTRFLSLPRHAQHICCCLLLPPQLENFSMIVY